jgi:hypothetical protein
MYFNIKNYLKSNHNYTANIDTNELHHAELSLTTTYASIAHEA